MKHINWRHASLFLGMSTLALSSTAFSAGFQLREFSSSIMGQAHAGSAVVKGDATSIFNNPATMASLNKNTAAASVNVLFPSFKFSKKTGTGNNGGDAGDMTAIPAAYLVLPMNAAWNIGFSYTVPWGLKTDYDKDWVGRLYALRSELQTHNFTPMVSYKVNPQWAVGGGIQIEYASAKLSNAFSATGMVDVNGQDWAPGFILGTTYDLTPCVHLGASYRSAINHSLTGSVTTTNRIVNRAIPNTGAGTKANVSMPDVLTLSGAYDFAPGWSVMADVQWTHWSKLKELRVKYNDGTDDTVENLSWSNTLFYSLGLKYMPTQQWAVKGGIAWDETPTKTETRLPRVPDSSRFWVSLGIDYMPSENLTASLGYTHIFARKATINQVSATKGTLWGEVNSRVDIVGLQVNYKF